MARFEFSPTPLAGLKLVQRKPLGDTRGFLARLFCAEEFEAAQAGLAVAQINHTLTSAQGTVRGMHFQHPPHADAKLVNCIRGSVFDIAVDLRRDSPTFLRWFGTVLSAENHTSLLIPQGFAHGFQALEDNCELIYLHSAAYAPAAEGQLHALDPRLAIAWPLPIGEMSARDQGAPWLQEDYKGVVL
jgi:dTDP-4-dehydrorhamnose 3,5-epimerase